MLQSKVYLYLHDMFVEEATDRPKKGSHKFPNINRCLSLLDHGSNINK
jgi:hypothetical protein